MRNYLAATIGTALLAVTFKLYGPVWLVLVAFFGSLLVASFGVWVGWGLGVDHAAEEAARLERHTHREGDPAPGTVIQLPRSGRLAVEPDPDDWRFAGAWDQGPVAASAEYELLMPPAPLTTPAELYGEPPFKPDRVDETDSGFTRRQAREVDALIAKWEAQTNYDCHTMRAD